MAIPAPYAVAIRLAGNLQSTTKRAIRIIAKAYFLKMLYAGFVVWEASKIFTKSILYPPL